MCSQALSFRGTVQQSTDLSTLASSCGGHLKTLLVQSVPTENGKTLHQHIFLCLSDHSRPPRPLWKGATVHDQTVHTCIGSGGGHFEHLLWIAVLYKNEIVIKWNVYCRYKSLYKILNISIFECNLSNSKAVHFRTCICSYERVSLFDAKNSPFCPSIYSQRISCRCSLPLSSLSRPTTPRSPALTLVIIR